MDINLRNAYYRGWLAAKREMINGGKVELIPSHMTPEEIVLYNRGLDDGRKRYPSASSGGGKPHGR